MTFENESCLSKIPDSSLRNVMWQSGWAGGLGENGYMYMYESLHCPPETITAHLVGYNTI